MARSARETIVTGATEARRRLPELLDQASRGTPVTIAAGKRLVTIVDREAWLSLLERVEAAEETAALLADPEAMQKLLKSERDVRRGQGVSIEQAKRLLGLPA
jgi:prevent-host-death family protein